MKRSARALAVAIGLAVAAVSGAARADDPPAADSAADARQQYQMGTQAFSQKRYSEAALHFEAAAAFKANAVALYTAALAWDLASRPERAADAYARALEVPGLDTKQTNVAKDRVAALEKSLGTVMVTAPEGWKVQLDTLTEVPAPARLLVAGRDVARRRPADVVDAALPAEVTPALEAAVIRRAGVVGRARRSVRADGDPRVDAAFGRGRVRQRAVGERDAGVVRLVDARLVEVEGTARAGRDDRERGEARGDA